MSHIYPPYDVERVLDRIQKQHLTPVPHMTGGMRITQPCHQHLESLALSMGWSKSAVMRALMDIAWIELTGKSIDQP